MKSLELDTNNITALLGLFQVSCEMGSFAKVIYYLQVYLQMHPGDTSVMFALSALYLKDGQTGQAERHAAGSAGAGADQSGCRQPARGSRAHAGGSGTGVTMECDRRRMPDGRWMNWRRRLHRLLEGQLAAGREGDLSRRRAARRVRRMRSWPGSSARRATCLPSSGPGDASLKRVYGELTLMLRAEQADVQGKLKQLRQVKTSRRRLSS